MKEYKIEILNDDKWQKFVPVDIHLTEDEAGYWAERIRELGGLAIITHPDDEPF